MQLWTESQMIWLITAFVIVLPCKFANFDARVNRLFGMVFRSNMAFTTGSL